MSVTIVGSPTEYDTIQEAIDAAADGDTIMIGEGTYAENVDIDKSVTLIGSGDAEDIIIQGTFKSDNGIAGSVAEFMKTATGYGGSSTPGLTVSADNVTIQNLTITSFLTGIELGNGVDHTTIEGVTIDGTVNGIRKGSGAEVSDLTVIGGEITDGVHGVYFAKETAETGKNITDVTFDGTHFENLIAKGIYAETLDGTTLFDNLTMDDVGQFGRGDAFGNPGEFGNGIDINLKFGVYSGSVIIEDFEFTNTGNSTGADPTGHFGGAAIAVKARNDANHPIYGPNPAEASGLSVLIQNGSIDGTSTGVRLGEPGKSDPANNTTGPDVTVTNVTIENNLENAKHNDFDNVSQGTLTVNGTAVGDTYTAVNSATSTGEIVFNGLGGNDVLTSAAGDDTLDGGEGDDTLDGGSGTDTAVYSGTVTVDATETGWSVNAGSEGTDSLSNVEMINDAADGKVLLVGNGGYDTIQAAVDAASAGDTILVAAGEYTGNVVIDKAVTLLGANAGIDGNGTRGAESVILGKIDVTSSAAVTIDGFQVLNTAATSGGGAANPALWFATGGSGDGHLVTHSVFKSIVAGGAVSDRAIAMGPIATGTVRIEDNLFTGTETGKYGTASWDRGIWSDGGGVELSITGNEFEYTRTAINYDGPDGASSPNLTIEGNIFGVAGTAMSFAAGGTVSGITDNTFDNVDTDFNFQNISNSLTLDLGATENLATDGQPMVVLGGSAGDTITGSAGTDVLQGNGGADVIAGAGGDDFLNGVAGDDTIEGGEGTDTIDGGIGVDTVVYNDIVSVNTSGGGWTVNAGAEGTDTLSNVEIVETSDGSHVLLVGNGGFATIQEAIDAAQDGDTVLISTGTYNEALSIDGKAITLQEAAGATVTVQAPGGSPAGMNAITLSGDFEGESVSIRGLEIVGVAGSNQNASGVYVMEGANIGTLTLDGVNINGAGAYGVFLNGEDRSIGGREAAASVVITNSTFSNNGYNGTNGSTHIKLFGFAGDATIQNVSIANSASGTLVGDRPDYGIELTGTPNPGTNPVEMGSVVIDNVTMTGYLHKNGFAVFNYASIDGLSIGSGDLDLSTVVTDWGPVFNIDGVLDMIDGYAYGVLLPASVIATELQGDKITQAVTNNIIIGTGAWDRLIGKGGDDQLWGEAGNDELYGHDKAGGAYINDDGDDQLHGGDGNDYLSGGAGDDTLDGGADSDNLVGGVGNDRLDGGADNDTMAGGDGDDTYVVDSAADAVTELDGEGTDKVESSIDYTLGAHLENLTLTGSADLIGTGNSLNNVIVGNGGANTLDGLTGDDTLRGEGGDDQLFGGADNDTLEGGSGQDFLAGSTGNDVLDGGSNVDTMIGGAGDDTYVVDDAGDVVSESANQGTDTVVTDINNYTLLANFENLTLRGAAALTGTGNSLVNVLTGNAGNNILNGLQGADTMIGGAGDDTYHVDVSGDVVEEEAGEGTNDTVISSVSYTLNSAEAAYVENLTLTGAALNATGNAQVNTLTGNDGNNVLDGLEGADTMIGGKGADTYYVDNSGDMVVEVSGQGVDIVISSASYTLASYVENGNLTGGSNLDLSGNNMANALNGNTGNNVLDGKGGADTMTGGLGDDTYHVDNTGDAVMELLGEGTDSVTSSVSYTLTADVENLTLTGAALNATGNAAENVLTGNTHANVLEGKGGADTMIGGDGNDTYYVNTGGDTVVEASSQGIDLVYSSVSYTLASNVENLTLTGTANRNVTGNAESNELIGNSGNNVLDGKDGADTMKGGLGDDTYYVDSNGDVVTEELAGGGIDSVISSVTFALGANVENLTLTGTEALNATGNSDVNELRGNAGNNVLDGLGGADTMIGGDGDDTYYVNVSSDVVVESTGRGTDIVYSTANYTLSGNVENLTLLGTANRSASGNNLANTLTGNSGNNVLNGKVGADTMIGMAGNDTYHVDEAGDVVVEATGEGTNDTVISSVSYTLNTAEAAFVENLTLTGTALDATGNAEVNTLTGNAENNTLDGLGGADLMIGGDGDDSYVVDDAGDTIDEVASVGNDSVTASVSYTLATNVENLTLTGAALNATGNAAANALTGNGNGNVLDGQGGADTMVGGDGSDSYVVDNAGDLVTELVDEGTADSVTSSVDYVLTANVENLTLTGSAIDGTGNVLGNTIVGNLQDNNLDGGEGNDHLSGDDGSDILTGANGDDSLEGEAGADTLLGDAGNDRLDGGTGVDFMLGGADNDTYVVDVAGDTIVEGNNQGTDTVETSINWTLGNYLENLTLTGSGTINGTGNSLANVITGNEASNTLTGGTGSDTFVFNTALNSATNVDNITDFSGSDLFNLSDSVFTALNEGTLTAEEFTIGASATNGAQRIVYDQANGTLSYDADGSGAEAAIQFATVTANTNLTHDDFVVI